MGLKGGIKGGSNLTLTGATGARQLLAAHSARLILAAGQVSPYFGMPGGYSPGSALVPAIKDGGLAGRSAGTCDIPAVVFVGDGFMTVSAAGTGSGTMDAIRSAYRGLSAAGVATGTVDTTGRGNMTLSVRIGADPSAEDIAQAVWNGTYMEDILSMRDAMRLMGAALLGKVDITGATVTFRDTIDTKDRIIATVDAAGQRTAVTLDGS